MKNFRDRTNVALALLLSGALIFAGFSLAPGKAAAQGSWNTPGNNMVLPNYRYPAMVFTATSQTKTQGIGGVSTATVQIFGVALTTVTWQLLCSNDGGTHFYGLPSLAAGGTAPITAGAITTTSAGLYYFKISGCTNFEIVTSGTFTATSVTAQVTASSNYR
jgi:hypothetical protein